MIPLKMHDTSFIQSRKEWGEWGESKIEIERETCKE
jgi:hypothetical protein